MGRTSTSQKKQKAPRRKIYRMSDIYTGAGYSGFVIATKKEGTKASYYVKYIKSKRFGNNYGKEVPAVSFKNGKILTIESNKNLLKEDGYIVARMSKHGYLKWTEKERLKSGNISTNKRSARLWDFQPERFSVSTFAIIPPENYKLNNEKAESYLKNINAFREAKKVIKPQLGKDVFSIIGNKYNKIK